MIRSEASPGTYTMIVWLTKSVHGHDESWAFESLRLPRAGETYSSFLWWLGKLRLLIRKGKISLWLKLFWSLDVIVRVWWLEFLTSFFLLLSESCMLINHQQVLGHTLILSHICHLELGKVNFPICKIGDSNYPFLLVVKGLNNMHTSWHIVGTIHYLNF